MDFLPESRDACGFKDCDQKFAHKCERVDTHIGRFSQSGLFAALFDMMGGGHETTSSKLCGCANHNLSIMLCGCILDKNWTRIAITW